METRRQRTNGQQRSAPSGASSFIEDVADELGCETAEAERLAVAVVTTLEERLFSLENVEDLEAELPERLRELVGQVDRLLDLPAMDEKAFCARVARRLKTTEDDSEATIAGVFRVLRSHLSPREARRVERDLPEDMARLWNYPGSFGRR